MNHSFKNGQSLVELAVFSSVMFMAIGALVSYALNYNQLQRISMLGAMRASEIALDVADTSLLANVVLIYDKALPDISSTLGMFGFSRRRPLQFSFSVTRSNALFSQPEWGKEEELSRTVFVINGNKRYELTNSGFGKRTFEYELVTSIQPGSSVPTTIKRYKTPKGNNFKHKQWRDGWWMNTHFANKETDVDFPYAWQWIESDGTIENQVVNLSSWDIDDDNEEESILNIINQTTQDASGRVIVLPYDEIQYTDNSLGMLDSSESCPQELSSGFISQFYEETNQEGTIYNEQKKNQYLTLTYQWRNQQLIERYLRLNWRLTKGSPAYNNLTQQIRQNNPGCNYDADCSCSPNLPRSCDCIGTKDDVVKGLLNLYQKEPYDIYEEVKEGRFLYEDIELPNGEILEDGRLYVQAKSNDPNKPNKSQATITRKVPLISGNYFLIIRSKYEGVPYSKIFDWTRENKK